jgi:nucleotide-binding universal stress UspA family protein
MLPLKKILCPIDFSDHCYDALDVAKELLETMSGELFLVHVVASVPALTGSGGVAGPTGFNIPLYEKNILKDAEKLMQEAIDKRIPEGLKVNSIVKKGHAADEIVKIAREKDVDLIVIATHGRTGIKRLFFGSVAENVLRHTSRPVLMIPIEEEE